MPTAARYVFPGAFSICRSFAIGILAAAASVLAGDAMADERPSSESAGSVAGAAESASKQEKKQEELDAWIEELGHDSYLRRESAARRLTKAGDAAERALAAAAERHRDLEVRLQCRAILTAIEARSLDERIQRFLNDIGGTDEYRLPGWRKFREVVKQDNGQTRRYFAEMVRVEFDLLSALEVGDASLQTALANRLAWHQQQAQQSGYQDIRITATGLGALLLAAIDVSESENTNRATIQSAFGQFIWLLDMAASRGTMNERDMKPAMGILEAWIRRGSNSGFAYQGLSLAMKFNMADAGRDLARKFLQDGQVHGTAITHAALTLGRYGDASDVPLLKRHLGEKTVCHTWTNPQIQKEPIRTQSRDVVLAVALHLQGKDIKQHGFEFAVPNQETLFHVYSLGFGNDEKREAAFKKFQDGEREAATKNGDVKSNDDPKSDDDGDSNDDGRSETNESGGDAK